MADVRKLVWPVLRLVLLGMFLGSGSPMFGQIRQTEPGRENLLTAPAPKKALPPTVSFQPQKYLALDKPGRMKRIRFFVGNEITFRLKGDPVTYHDVIAAVDDSSFTIFGTKVPLREVDRIVVRNQGWFLNQGAALLPLAGGIYFLADNLNPVLSGDGGFAIHRGSVVVGAGLVGAGLILRIFQVRQHKMNKRKQLRVLETF
ncbi:MAG: hypothetical protein H7Z75_08600 [Ferruginibacter sp.]|nr:hypothetical protein [Cytophagales bacterium]